MRTALCGVRNAPCVCGDIPYYMLWPAVVYLKNIFVCALIAVYARNGKCVPLFDPKAGRERSIEGAVNFQNVRFGEGRVVVGKQPLLRAHHIFGKGGQIRLVDAVFPQGFAF